MNYRPLTIPIKKNILLIILGICLLMLVFALGSYFYYKSAINKQITAFREQQQLYVSLTRDNIEKQLLETINLPSYTLSQRIRKYNQITDLEELYELEGLPEIKSVYLLNKSPGNNVYILDSLNKWQDSKITGAIDTEITRLTNNHWPQITASGKDYHIAPFQVNKNYQVMPVFYPLEIDRLVWGGLCFITDLNMLLESNIQTSRKCGQLHVFDGQGQILYTQANSPTGANISGINHEPFQTLKQHSQLLGRVPDRKNPDSKKLLLAEEEVEVGGNQLIIALTTPRKNIIANFQDFKNKFILWGLLFFTLVIGGAVIVYRFNKNTLIKTYLSFHDEMTGLYNRRYFENELTRLNTSRRLPISIIIGDLDQLKYINDNYGHKMGDQYIKNTAKLLTAATRTEDIVARIGGDEFGLVLPETGATTAHKLCYRIKEEYRQFNKDNKLPLPLKISVGYATKTDKSQDLQDIFHKADQHMYRNKKRASRNSSSEEE